MLIQLGLRSILSLAGIVILVIGVWQVDRAWDEDGAAEFERARDEDPQNPVVSEANLDAALRFPFMFLLGWALFAISYLFPTDGSFSPMISATAVLAAITAVGLASVGSLPMADSVRHRRAKKKMILSVLFLTFWIVLTVFTGLGAVNQIETFVFGAVGMTCIVMSMMLLWKYRKMGTSWEETGEPNPRPVVYNLGGPFFVLGWTLFWIAMASTDPSTADGGLLLDLNLRTALAFIAGFGIVLSVFTVDYAHDEGGKYVGFGTDGSHVGRIPESPGPFIAMWVLFGLVAFIAPDNSIGEASAPVLLLLLTCVVMGPYVGLGIQTTIYKANGPLMQKLAMGFVMLLLVLAVLIGWNGGVTALVLAIVGVLLVAMSQAKLMMERKRGRYWIENGEPNPRPIVYSFGTLMFPTGWLITAWAISIAG